MKLTLAVGILAHMGTALAACAANDCARAVTGTRDADGKPPLASRQADCISAIRVTVTPTAS